VLKFLFVSLKSGRHNRHDASGHISVPGCFRNILIAADTTVMVNAVIPSLNTAQDMNDLNEDFVTVSHHFHCYKRLLNLDVPSWALPRRAPPT
jgi:hypothetical protein